jgi:predicted aconitase with swiveling domain/8-oxo-dGTP pyrophosphatase MutT (NUDIX family)
LILTGRGISKGVSEGQVLMLEKPFSFLGGVDPKTGLLSNTSGAEGRDLRGMVFVFPCGKGSTVGSYTLLQLRRESRLPAAIINQNAETIVATGAVMANVPMVDRIDISLLRDGDVVKVDGEKGTVDILGVKVHWVVTSVLINDGKLLVLKRSDKVSTCQGMWAGVSGYIEPGEEPLQTANKEIAEETGITKARLLRTGEMLMVRQRDNIWAIHPFLFQSPTDKVAIDWEHTDYRWVLPSEMEGLELVPGFRRLLGDLGL